MTGLILASLLGSLAQADDTVRRNDPNRTAYQDAVDACRDAERFLPAAPDQALARLVPVFVDGIDKNRLSLVERRIFIETKSQEFSPHEFYPYYLRGWARLLAARKKSDETEARRLLLEAATDLSSSLRRGAARSSAPLAEAQGALWENARGAVAFEGWKPGRLAQIDQTFALLAGTPLGRESAEWTQKEIGRVDARLRELRKDPGDPDSKRPYARRAAEWCEALGASIRGIPAFEPALGALGGTGTLAASIRDSRGRFRLRIGVAPWATVERLEREGEVIALVDRDTPLVVPQELEIDDYTIELVHPKGRKTARILAKSLEPGRTYVLWGDMGEGKFDIAELSK